jgi:hypothetical protein
MVPFFKFALTTLIVSASNAAKIVEWNQDNVDVGTPAEGETGKSIVYTGVDKTETFGGVLWTQEADNVQSPGMKVVTDGSGSGTDGSCIMTSGFNPSDSNNIKQCDDPQQTSKRAKVYTDNLNGAVDLVFDVEEGDPVESDPADSTYRFFLKYENLSSSRIKSFKIQLGTGIGQDFTLSTENDGVAFAKRDGSEVLNQTNIDSYSDNELATVFAFGLFGNAETSDVHGTDGYYDPTDRARFTMKILSEDELKAFPVTDNIASLYGGAMQSWINKAIAPQGYSYDHDGIPDTEAVLVADFDASGNGWQIRRLCSDNVTEQLIAASLLNDTECRLSANDNPVPLSQATLDLWSANTTLFAQGPIEDFGNVNVNAHIKIEPGYLPEGSQNGQLTIRLIPEKDLDDPGSPWNVHNNGGIGGDPHFKRWGQPRDSFHGECDLVMLHSDNFHNQAGFDLHVRTTIDTYYSYVESGAFRVGNTIVEMERHHFYVNGVKKTKDDLPYTFGSDEFRYTIHHERDDGRVQVYRVDLSEESSLLFKFFKQYLTISTDGSAKDFGDSVGLMGDFYTGDMYSRYGKRMSNFQDFCFEWQVNTNANDMQLFRTAREPQLPYEKCRLPSLPRPSRRKLLRGDRVLYDEARRACAAQSGTDFDLCVDDVVITGEIGIAENW